MMIWLLKKLYKEKKFFEIETYAMCCIKQKKIILKKFIYAKKGSKKKKQRWLLFIYCSLFSFGGGED